MSLAWPEPFTLTEIYLGRQLAVIASARHAPLRVRYAPTLPLARVLAQLHPSAGALLPAGRALRLRLGAAFCPPVAFRVPDHITRWRALQAWARQCAAEALATEPEQLMVDSNRLHHGLAAALPCAVHDTLRAWAASHRLAIRSLGPLWSEATRCGQARRADALWVWEPDGLVRLPGPSAHPAQGASFEPTDADPDAPPEPPPDAALCPPGGGSATALVFRPHEAASRCVQGPSFMPMHWRAVRAP